MARKKENNIQLGVYLAQVPIYNGFMNDFLFYEITDKDGNFISFTFGIDFESISKEARENFGSDIYLRSIDIEEL